MKNLSTILLVTLILILLGCQREPEQPSQPTEALSTLIAPLDEAATLEDSLCVSLEVDSKRLSYSKDRSMVTLRVPKGIPLDVLAIRATQILQNSHYTIVDAFHNPKRGRVLITSVQDKDTLKVRLIRTGGYYPNTGTISLVLKGIDTCHAATRLSFLSDSAYTFNYLIPSWSKKRDTTISILGRYGGSVIIQIPLESRYKAYRKKTPHTIYVDDTKKEMLQKIEPLIEDTSVVALASFGGDYVLNSLSATTAFMTILGKHNLRFYDMRTNQDNLAFETADAQDVEYENVRQIIHATNVKDITEALKTYAYKATRRKNVTVWADATPELREALDSSKTYFKTLGISLIAIENN